MAQTHHTEALLPRQTMGELHATIRGKESLERALSLVSLNPGILWHPNAVGWTALHFGASHRSTHEWLRLLSSQADCPHDLVHMRTDVGHSCIDLWFRRHLNPFPWQSLEVKETAQSVQDAMETCMTQLREHQSLRVVIRDRLEGLHERRVSYSMSSLKNELHHDDSPLSSAVETVAALWFDMEKILMAATLDTNDANVSPSTTILQDSHPPRKSFRVLHALALVGCPPIIARLAVSLFPDQLDTVDQDGNLPLHVAARAAFTTNIVYEDEHPCPPILRALLDVYPHAARRTNCNGRLPLNVALASGNTSQATIQTLMDAYPAALYGASGDDDDDDDDGTSWPGLSSFALAAIPHDPAVAHAHAKRRACQTIGGMYRFLASSSQQTLLNEAREQDDLLQLTVVYDLLRAFPAAIDYGSLR